MKATTLAVMAKDIALERGDLSSWGSVAFWVDKACIPQDHEDLKAGCCLVFGFEFSSSFFCCAVVVSALFGGCGAHLVVSSRTV